MTGFLNLENTFNPSNNFMRRRVNGFIKVENTILDILIERALDRRVTGGKRSVVSGSHVEAVVVFEEDRPL